jgi:16S rRNA (uracil1498-N3)-methyltransferase
MQRFFVPQAILSHSPVVLTGDVAHQMRRVLRLAPGDRVLLLDGAGDSCEAEVEAISAKDVRLKVLCHEPAAGEPCVHITLYQAVLKGERFAWALQKGTEVGVSAFVPVITERSIIDDLQVVEAKRERWQRIIQEAAEQCGRGRVPALLPGQMLRHAIKHPGWPGALRMIPWEGLAGGGENALGLASILGECNLNGGARIEVFVGPEGGFTDAEIDWARRHDVQPVSLGRRILRAETAGLVAAVGILYQAGEL